MNDTSDLEIDLQYLKLGTFNTRGLKHSLKQDTLLKKLTDLKLNIIGLQETHLSEKDINLLENKWKGTIIYTEGTNHSKGLCILFDNYFKKDNIKLIFKNERIILSSCKIGDMTLYVCNIYAPNNINEKIKFFKNFQKILSDHVNDFLLQSIVVLGDFNCVLNNKLDILSGSNHNINSVKAFNLMVNENDLIDIWRLNNKNDKNYTWSGSKPLVARRLDYIFVSRYFLPFVTDCHIASIGHSDHRIVICNLEFNKFERGKGTYKMNNNLFENLNFKNSIKNLIKESIDELSDLDPVLKWEAIKLKIKEHLQNFGKYNKFKNKEENQDLERKLSQLENDLAKNINDIEKQKEINNIKTKLELKNIQNATAARIRSKVQWIEEGEKCSRYIS